MGTSGNMPDHRTHTGMNGHTWAHALRGWGETQPAWPLDKLRSLHQPEAGLPPTRHPSTHGSKAEVPFWALSFPGWGRSVRAARRGDEGQGRCQAAAWGP